MTVDFQADSRSSETPSGKEPRFPGDPYANVPAPVRRGPKGRSGAAVAEIEDDSFRSFPPRRG
jgi:hypothetical protein